LFAALGLLSLAGGIVAADRPPQRESSPVVLRTARVVDGHGVLEAIDVVIEAGWDGGLYAQLGMSLPTAGAPRGSSVFFRAGLARSRQDIERLSPTPSGRREPGL
jgi:hypothetical protein